MDPHTRVEIERATQQKPKQPVCKACRMIRMYLIFAVPVLFFIWAGVDFNFSDVDPKDVIVKVVLLILGIQIVRRIYIDFIKRP
tara:strand:+ start:64 stop:315 length:252 start_codon:yes stop_codon:yes gene_type:complete